MPELFPEYAQHLVELSLTMAFEATEEIQRSTLDESGKRVAIEKFQSAIAIAKELLYASALANDETSETEVDSSSPSNNSGTYEIKAYSFLFGQK